MANRSAGNAAGRPYLPEVTVAAGAAKETNITVTGIRIGVDLLDSVIAWAKGGLTFKDITSTCTVTSNGNIQTTGEDAKEGTCLVFWRKKQP